MHREAYQFVEMVVSSLPLRKRVLEIGSRNINGSVRPLFMGAEYLGIDTAAGLGVDETADGAQFQPGQALDTVVCCEVLEHTESAADIIGNSLRILQPGGVLIVTCAAPPRAPHSAVDGGALQPGEYYQNIYPKQLQHWTEHWGGAVTMLSYVPSLGDVYLWATKCQ
jgi:SAM-dependent methyltransferase